MRALGNTTGWRVVAGDAKRKPKEEGKRSEPAPSMLVHACGQRHELPKVDAGKTVTVTCECDGDNAELELG